MAKLKSKVKKKWSYFITIMAIIILGVSSWTVYQLVNKSLSDLLAKFGVESFYLQGLIIIVFALIFLMLIGVGVFKGIEKIIKR